MANVKRTKTTLKKGDNLPPRGRSVKTIILEALRDESLLGLSPNATKDESEKAYWSHLLQRATNPEDNNSAMLLKVATDKGWATLKPVGERVKFEFDKNLAPHEKADQIIDAAAKGDLPPEVANTFIQSIKAMIDIEEYTSLKARIEQLEKVLNGGA